MGIAHNGKILSGFAHNGKKIAGFAHNGKIIYRSGPSAGSIMWSKPLESKILAIGAGDTMVAVATEDSNVTIFDADGNLVGSGSFTGTPIRIEVFDTVSMGTAEGAIYEYVINDGKVSSRSIETEKKRVAYSRYEETHYLFDGSTANTYHWDDSTQKFVQDTYVFSNFGLLFGVNEMYYAGYDVTGKYNGSGLRSSNLSKAGSVADFVPVSCYLSDSNYFFTFTDAKKFAKQQVIGTSSPGYDMWKGALNTVDYTANEIYADDDGNVFAVSFADGNLHKIASTGLPAKDWSIADSFSGFAVGKDASETYVVVPDSNEILKVFLK